LSSGCQTPLLPPTLLQYHSVTGAELDFSRVFQETQCFFLISKTGISVEGNDHGSPDPGWYRLVTSSMIVGSKEGMNAQTTREARVFDEENKRLLMIHYKE
jgi:hypothetical protein